MILFFLAGFRFRRLACCRDHHRCVPWRGLRALCGQGLRGAATAGGPHADRHFSQHFPRGSARLQWRGVPWQLPQSQCPQPVRSHMPKKAHRLQHTASYNICLTSPQSCFTLPEARTGNEGGLPWHTFMRCETEELSAVRHCVSEGLVQADGHPSHSIATAHSIRACVKPVSGVPHLDLLPTSLLCVASRHLCEADTDSAAASSRHRRLAKPSKPSIALLLMHNCMMT